jgi:hypothetical protein
LTAISEVDTVIGDSVSVITAKWRFAMKTVVVCGIRFTTNPECNNCLGSGVFSEDEDGTPIDPCVFCLEDAAERGEVEYEDNQ